jgi:hypothetical protein
MKCNRAHKAWFGSALGIKFDNSHTNFIDWIYYCFTTLKEEDLCHIAAISYGIWQARNKLVFEGTDMEDKRIGEQAYSSVNEFQIANFKTNQREDNNNYSNQSTNRRTRTHASHHRRNKQNPKWRKPSNGRIKANSDANLSVDGSWGLGAIFRDDEGQILASATWKLPGFADPSTAEACTLYFTARLTVDCCFTNVDFESDCRNAIESISDTAACPRSYFGNLVKAVQLNSLKFNSCTFRHIDRRANKVAHELASLAHFVTDSVWLEDTHPLIVPFVHMDLF